MESANSVLAFYREVMRRLAGNGIEFLVGGGYAFGHYTGLQRDTKDFVASGYHGGDCYTALVLTGVFSYRIWFFLRSFIRPSEKSFLETC